MDVPVMSPRPRLLTRPRRMSQTNLTRPGLRHMLLWLTMISLYFALAENLLDDRPRAVIGVFILVGQAVIAGAAWSGLLITLSRSWRRVAVIIEPGQWLMVVVGVRLLAEALLRLPVGQVFVVPEAMTGVCTCCVLVVPTLSKHLSMPWKLLFSLLAVSHGAPFGLAVSQTVFGLPHVIHNELIAWWAFLLSLGIPPSLAIWLQMRGERSTWLHWAGVSVWCLWLLLQPRILELALG